MSIEIIESRVGVGRGRGIGKGRKKIAYVARPDDISPMLIHHQLQLTRGRREDDFLSKIYIIRSDRERERGGGSDAPRVKRHRSFSFSRRLGTLYFRDT